MTATRLVAAIIALAGAACYNPTFPVGRPCLDGECPDGQVCDLVMQVCLPPAEACTTSPCERVVAEIPVTPNRDLDLLFVIDNSGSMSEEQTSLVNNFQRFINVLQNVEGGLPNLHIGVISTDVGAGPFNISGCSGSGDNGVLQSVARNGACNPPSGAYISDVGDPTGGRITNYTGTLADAFGCIAELGIAGCGFEQPLESMRRALNGSNPTNVGFLRPNALLGVILLTDEDDCSTEDSSMFDTSQTMITDPLGPLSSFRCFEFGVVCDDDDNVRTVGEKHNCSPRENSQYMYAVGDYVDFLKGLKSNPDDVFVAGIFGNPSPVRVKTSEGTPLLDFSCLSASGEAAPGIRLQAFTDAFGVRGTSTTICNDDLSDALISIAGHFAVAAGSPCLNADLDLDTGAAGVQYQCRVALFDNGNETELPECSGGTQPCFSIVPEPITCSDSPNRLALSVDWGAGAPPSSGHYIVRCLVL